uniref:Cytochrome c oxidase subunit 3 n=1 Tax=Colponema vietnamica TaxID=1492817 RepID=V5KV64_9ALVE|nr:cytochrome c oxidase subunit 3 [Colponema vietnamica]ATY40857.1 cytochrome c oxidase subunit III [Colponema vietnamica]
MYIYNNIFNVIGPLLTSSQIVKSFINTKKYHDFHLLNQSPWPFLAAYGVFFLILSNVLYMFFFTKSKILILFAVVLVALSLVSWWRDVTRESNPAEEFYNHTPKVQSGLRSGMAYFIFTEVMFFIGFFWAFFTLSINASVEFDGMWPPRGITPIDAQKEPLWNTYILLFSGVFATISHIAVRLNFIKITVFCLLAAIILGLGFSWAQGLEYAEAAFSLSDSSFGSVFYLLTGFHGFHVFIGTLFLIVCMVKGWNFTFTSNNHVGLESALWYWHFVDIVWLAVFFLVYYNI